jgi:lipoprotein-anchoring transpeptidase ErfK/SrfK
MAVAAFAGLALAVPAQADDRVIAVGVNAGGVDVGGLTVDAAAAKLSSILTPQLSRDIFVEARPSSYRLTAAQAKLSFDALRTAQRAAHVVPEPPAPTAGGAAAATTVPLAVTHSRLAVRDWIKQIAGHAYRPPRSATLKITVRHLRARKAVLGSEIDRTATAALVDAAIDGRASSRLLRATMRTVRPKVNADGLRKLYGTVITVDRSTFTLRLFKRLKLRKRYGIAVGMAGLDTPAGTYRIQSRQVDPAWHVPHSAWAGSLQGQVIPGGAANNPLKARWLGIANGVGIHGTSEEWSIGSRASHGCILIRVADVIDLYPRVPIGTTVLIK